MGTAISVIYYLLVGSAILYFIVLVTITLGWFKLKRFEGSLSKPYIPVSVVVAIRNEETGILKLLHSLKNQDYPQSNFEVILVDDHSDDNTIEVINSFLAIDLTTNFKLLHATGEGKKNALSDGFKVAKGDLILTTDGDCEAGPKWISRMVSFYQLEKSKLIIGPVLYRKEKGIFHQFFSLDFMSLIASGAGSSGIGKPIMGNGANLAIENKSMTEIESGKKHASGDDVFLIQHMVKTKGAKTVQFIRDPDAMVFTKSAATMIEFFKQRIRWASKAVAYKSVWSIVVSLSVFLFNTLLVVTLLSGLFQSWMVAIFALFILFKMLVDLPLLNEFTRFANRRDIIWFLPLFELIYPFYIFSAAIAGLFFRYEWKGRKNLR